jgi:hypothetical protein
VVPLRRNRDFLLLWSGEVVSTLGSRISLVAFPLLVLATTDSPARAGLVGFANQVPVLAFGGLPFGQIMIVAFLAGTRQVFYSAAEHGALPLAVSPSQVSDAIARNQARLESATRAEAARCGRGHPRGVTVVLVPNLSARLGLGCCCGQLHVDGARDRADRPGSRAASSQRVREPPPRSSRSLPGSCSSRSLQSQADPSGRAYPLPTLEAICARVQQRHAR